ncbi:hypothetical protein BLA29_009441 [Euroglyphus maynei]|uniref:Uncharacterized protein n=1 Tax=Euroglyphus maynei TaxID=6958 RepID=A0A1Y3ASC8_EURMA|nr:hypothetical protein BLA29_009441 [Euroglyphus maynei]
MNNLGYKEYSIYGFGIGGQIAIIMAKKFGQRIKSMILHATTTYSDEKLLQNYKQLRDPDCWNDSLMIY